MICLAGSVIERLGLKDIELHINSIGCPHCRAKYYEKLREFFAPHKEELCGTCQSRFEKNPMRILDCKSEICREIGKDAPLMIDYLCDECREHFETLKGYLDEMGIKYTVDPKIVRGLDYYTKTVLSSSPHLSAHRELYAAADAMTDLLRRWAATPLLRWALPWAWKE